MNTLLHLSNISKTFKTGSKTIKVLDHISLQVREQEFLVIVGPSGSGKSTLLRIMSGLDQDYSGKVTYSENIDRSEVSFVFQHFSLLPWLTIYQNIEIGILSQPLSDQEKHHRILEQLKKFELTQFADAYPRNLSGGMQQRVGLARALINKPKILFMDEPFSELDSFTAEELRKQLLVTWKELSLTIVMVTHIVQEAIQLADRIAVFTPRPGKIENTITNRISRPRNKRASEFFAMEDRLYSLVRP